MNVLTIKRNLEGLPVALHITNGDNVDNTISLYDATFSDLTGGTSIISWGDGSRARFTLDTHADDNGVDGAVAYAELIRLTTHTKHPHGHKPVITDPLDVLRTQIRTLETMLEASVPVVFTFGKVNLREYTRRDGSRHYGWHFFNTDNSEFEFATGDFTYGLVKVSDDERYLRVRTYNEARAVVQELRAPVSTNDFAGWDFIINGLVKTYTGAFAYSDLLVAESVAAGDASGDAGGSGGDAT